MNLRTWLLLALLGPQAAHALEPRVVGMIVDGSDYGSTLFRDEIRALSDADFDIQFPDDALKVGDWDPATIDRVLDELLADPDVDVIVALGVLASHQAARRAELAKPVVAPFVIDPQLQGLPLTEGTSGVHNLTYLTYPSTVDRDLRALHELIEYQHVAFALHAPWVELLPSLPAVSAAEELGFAISVVPVAGRGADALDELPDGVDAVYLTPLPEQGEDGIELLAEALVERGLPSFSQQGRADVDRGILAGLDRGSTFQRIARRTGLAVQEILLGADAATLPVTLTGASGTLVLNVATAQLLGVSPRWDLLWEAELLHEHEALPHEELGLRDAVQQALAANPALAATEIELDADDAGRLRATSRWLPQVRAAAQGEINDRPQAQASFGSVPQESIGLGLTAEQLVFADGAVADIGIQRDLVDARAAALERARADLAHEVSLAWTDVHRAQALIDVRANDVRQIHNHLEVARSRYAIGEVSDADVARFEAEIAQARRRMVAARTAHRQAEMRLNQLRGVEASDHFLPEPFDERSPPGGIAETRIAALTDNPRAFGRLVELMVPVGLAAAPELAQLDAAISAQDRGLGVARRSWWAPTVGVTGTAGYSVLRTTATPDFPTLPDPIPEVEQILAALPGDPPDAVWSVGAAISVPVFSGGALVADRREAGADLAALQHQRESVAQQLELRIRAALSGVNGSFASVELARQATEGAQRSLEYASEAYARGLASQVTLLEARSASLTAELGHTDAEYVLLADLLEVQRATNHQFTRMSPDEWLAFLASVEAALEEAE